MAGRADYEERKQARIDRLNDAADNARERSNAACSRAHDMGSVIPFGQPVHGAADRRYRERIGETMDRAVAEDKKADYYERRAEAAENNTAISSDDPNSVEKLQAKIDALRAEQTRAKALNTYYKKHGTAKCFEGLTDAQAAAIDAGARAEYNFEKRPYPSYMLTSINQRIKAAEERIERIKRTEAMPDEVIHYNRFEIESSSEDNRVSFRFDERVPETIYARLKSNGYKWAHSTGKWQRLRTPQAWALTKRLADEFSKYYEEV